MARAFFWHISIAIICFVQGDDLLAPYRKSAESWEPEIQKLEQADELEKADRKTILLLGSSSIRLWDSIDEDLPDRKTIRRAYGGARFSDLAVHVDRLIAVHHPRAIVIFVANDISGDKERDLPPEKVIELAEYILNRIRHKFEDVPIFVLAITPTPSRFAVWPQICKVNEGLERISRLQRDCFFLPTEDFFMDEQGHPRPDLFQADQLHLNHQGYRIWAELLENTFQAKLRDNLDNSQLLLPR